jgi:hypothetical protein
MKPDQSLTTCRRHTVGPVEEDKEAHGASSGRDDSHWLRGFGSVMRPKLPELHLAPLNDIHTKKNADRTVVFPSSPVGCKQA